MQSNVYLCMNRTQITTKKIRRTRKFMNIIFALIQTPLHIDDNTNLLEIFFQANNIHFDIVTALCHWLLSTLHYTITIIIYCNVALIIIIITLKCEEKKYILNIFIGFIFYPMIRQLTCKLL